MPIVMHLKSSTCQLQRNVKYCVYDNMISVTGYRCEEFNNPPDFFLDIINGDSTAVKSLLEHGKYKFFPIRRKAAPRPRPRPDVDASFVA